jgi:hypothetical protein
LDITIDTTGTGLILSPRTVRVIVPSRPVLTGPNATQARQPVSFRDPRD